MRKQFEHARARVNSGPGDRPGLSVLGLMACMLLVLVGMTAYGVVNLSTPATAAPGSPGVTQPGTLIYTEDFSSANAATAPIPLGSYVGGAAATNEQYTADPAWLPGAQECNGWIMREGTPLPTNGGLLNILTNDECGRNTAFTNSARWPTPWASTKA
ncbi:hypothetical protein [Arthrobacter sp. fls2-241-R2A-200]|uniref:hypothetical protein n=1 Tax=Arthrobacter sp. fls2-241-R2A-200 TaxID=3040281 RepID=UPI00254CAA65|nr:hypothetical protein [Arthrobacter sp. fls2-241-R2A-200]